MNHIHKISKAIMLSALIIMPLITFAQQIFIDNILKKSGLYFEGKEMVFLIVIIH